MELIAITAVVLALFLLQNGLYKNYAVKNLEYRCTLSTHECYEGDEIELVVDDEDDGFENIVRDENMVVSDEELAQSGFGMEDENGDPIRDQLGFDFEEVFEDETGADEEERFPECL